MLDSRAALRREWLWAAGAIAAGLLSLIALFWDAVEGAIAVWNNSPTYNHCYLIIPISAYLIWERREVFARVAPAPDFRALALVAPIAAFWLVAHSAGVQEFEQFALVGMIQVVFLLVLGWPAYRALMFPLLYLFFLVPSGEYLVPSLQDFTGSFVVRGLEIIGIPVFNDGVIIQTPGGTFLVAEACAGLRFLIASVAFGFLFADLIYRRWHKRVIFVIASFIVPIIANGFRALGIVLIAEASNHTLAVGVDHIVYGWGFFAFVTVMLIVIGLRFRDPMERPTPTAPPAAGMAGPGRFVAASLAGLVAIGLAPAYAFYLETTEPAIDRAALIAPAPVGAWRLAATPASWKSSFANSDAEANADYAGAAGTATLHVAFYAKQQKGRELIQFDHRMENEPWQRIAGGGETITVDGERVQVQVTRLSWGQRRRLVYHWYWIDGAYTARKPIAKLLQVRGELLSGRRSAAMIAVSIEESRVAEDSRRALADLVARLPLRDMLERTARGKT